MPDRSATAREIASAYSEDFSEISVYSQALAVAQYDITIFRLRSNMARVIESFAEVSLMGGQIRTESDRADERQLGAIKDAMRHLELLSKIEGNLWAQRKRVLLNLLALMGHNGSDPET